MHKRIIPLLICVALLFSSCDLLKLADVKSSADTKNTNKKNSIKVNKNDLDDNLTLSPYYSRVSLDYGYRTLETDDMCRVYNAILEHTTAFTDEPNTDSDRKNYLSETFTVEDCSITKRQLAKVFCAVFLDNPDIFWVDDPYVYSISDNSLRLTLYMTMTRKTFEKRTRQLNSVINKILSGMKSGLSEFGRELYLHDYLVKNCKYNKNADETVSKDPYTVYGCLVNQDAVCLGYTNAFQLLLSYVGIKSVTVHGSDTDTGHIWNAVKLGGDWYYTDVTWDDINDISMYDYFNVTTKQLKKTHQIVPKITAFNDEELFDEDGTITTFNLVIPKCTATKYNYYRYKGSVLSDLDSNTLSEDLAKVARKQGGYFHIYVNPKKLRIGEVYDELFSEYSFDFADYIREANRLLGYDALKTSVSVNKKDHLHTISVELEYN